MINTGSFLRTEARVPLEDVTIDELTAKDLHAGFLTALASLAEVRLTPDEASKIMLDRLRLGIRTYVARWNGTVVGTTSLLVEPKFIHGGGLVGHVEDVAIHVDYQGRGIGTLLVKHATQQARLRGCYKVILDCTAELVPFYERLGYRRHNIGMRQDF